MKKLLILFSAAVVLCSCQKKQENSIVGTWFEVSAYRMDNAGQYGWGPATKFPLHLYFGADGKYSARNDAPADHGNYQFNHSTRELKLERLNPVSTATYTVSQLDDNYLIIEYHPNYKIKFIRS